MTNPVIPIHQPVRRCEERARLLEEYATAVDEFSRTLNILSSRMGVLPKSKYQEIRLFADNCRVRSEVARLALERHINEHGC